MEVITWRTPNWQEYYIRDADTKEDISQFCWAADDKMGLCAMFENDGKQILSSKNESNETHVQTFTYERNIEIVRKNQGVN